MSLKVGQRVVEKGRKGTVVAFHTKGTVDVHFDDMEHEIRRQIYQVQPLRKNNPKKANHSPASLLIGGTVGWLLHQKITRS